MFKDMIIACILTEVQYPKLLKFSYEPSVTALDVTSCIVHFNEASLDVGSSILISAFLELVYVSSCPHSSTVIHI